MFLYYLLTNNGSFSICTNVYNIMINGIFGDIWGNFKDRKSCFQKNLEFFFFGSWDLSSLLLNLNVGLTSNLLGLRTFWDPAYPALDRSCVSYHICNYRMEQNQIIPNALTHPLSISFTEVLPQQVNLWRTMMFFAGQLGFF